MIVWWRSAILLLMCMGTVRANCNENEALFKNRFFHFERTNCTLPNLKGRWKIERWLPNQCSHKPPAYTGYVDIIRVDARGDQIAQYTMNGTLKDATKSVKFQASLQWFSFNRLLFGPWMQNGAKFGLLGYKLEPREPETLEGYFSFWFKLSRGKDRLTRVKSIAT